LPFWVPPVGTTIALCTIRIADPSFLELKNRYFKQEGLSYLSYHFRALEKAGLIEVIETAQRRGATEHIYRGCARVFYTSEEFDNLPLRERTMLSRTSFQGLMARTDSAISSGTFDKRTNRK
jgi:hypothetical protein